MIDNDTPFCCRRDRISWMRQSMAASSLLEEVRNVAANYRKGRPPLFSSLRSLLWIQSPWRPRYSQPHKVLETHKSCSPHKQVKRRRLSWSLTTRWRVLWNRQWKLRGECLNSSQISSFQACLMNNQEILYLLWWLREERGQSGNRSSTLCLNLKQVFNPCFIYLT